MISVGTSKNALRLFSSALFVVFASDALADDGPARFDYGEISGVVTATSPREGYLSFGSLGHVYDDYAAWKSQVSLENSVSWLVEDRMILQSGNKSTIADNELNLIGRAEFARDFAPSWSINLWGQLANTLGTTTQSEFQTELGVLSPLNGGNSGPENTNEILQMLAFEYINPDETLRFQVGKLAVRTLMNLNRYAHGDSDSFFTPMLGNNPVVPYTALLGLGVFGQYRADNWYLSGLMRAPDAELGLSTSALHNGSREYILEAALTPSISGLGYGEYRLTFSHLVKNGNLPRVDSISFSADQDLGDRLGGFIRYAQADDTFRDFKQRVAAGLIVKRPFGFKHDRSGFGAWHGKPTDQSLKNETGVEIHYRAQLSPFLQVTPDIQVVFDPANSARSSEIILGLRLRVEL